MILSSFFRIVVTVWLTLLPSAVAGQDGMPANWPWRGLSIGFPDGEPADLVRYVKKLDINVVRLHVLANLYAERNKVGGDIALKAGIRWLDEMLDECARLGIGAVINYGQFPVGHIGKNGMTSDNFWSDPQQLNEVIEVVEKLAGHFRLRGSELVAYDIISEPLLWRNGKALSPPQWPDLLNRIVATINRIDPERWVVVAPAPGGGPPAYEKFSPPHGEKMIWGVHMYLPHAFTHQGIHTREHGKSYPGWVRLTYWDKKVLRKKLTSLIRFQNHFPAPLFVGEFGAVRWARGGEEYLRDLVDLFDEQGWGWAYFSGTGWHGWHPDYNSSHGDNQQAKSQVVGEGSLRWQTLRSIFNVEEIQ